MRSHRSVSIVTALAAAALGLVLATGPAATADPVAERTITPGVQMLTKGAQCTANFVFTDGADTYLGYAAHCASDGGEATDTNGCAAKSLPTGTPVDIQGASRPGTLAYSSWHTMQQPPKETDPETCLYNDFALVKIHSDDVGRVDPTIPHWGGPVGPLPRTEALVGGETVHGYGNSSLRFGLTVLAPKTGLSMGTVGGGWSHQTYTLTPGIPGDSGSALVDAEGNAVGVLSTLAIAPMAGSNNYTDLAKALHYANHHGGMAVELVAGERAFNGAQLPLNLGGLGLGL